MWNNNICFIEKRGCEPLLDACSKRDKVSKPTIITKNIIKRKCNIRNSEKGVNLNCNDKLRRRRGREKTKNIWIFHRPWTQSIKCMHNGVISVNSLLKIMPLFNTNNRKLLPHLFTESVLFYLSIKFIKNIARQSCV